MGLEPDQARAQSHSHPQCQVHPIQLSAVMTGCPLKSKEKQIRSKGMVHAFFYNSRFQNQIPIGKAVDYAYLFITNLKQKINYPLCMRQTCSGKLHNKKILKKTLG